MSSLPESGRESVCEGLRSNIERESASEKQSICLFKHGGSALNTEAIKVKYDQTDGALGLGREREGERESQ